MFGGLVKKIVNGFNFSKSDLVLILILLLFTLGVWQNTFKLTTMIETQDQKLEEMDLKMDERHQELIDRDNAMLRTKGSAVLTTLLKNDMCTTESILEFLAQKPAGLMDLKLAVTNDDIFDDLVEIYGDLARAARAAFQ